MTRSDYADRRDGAKRGLSDECLECGSQIRSTSGETVCDGCGLVLEETPIDTGPEWRGFDSDDNRERTGAPITPTRHDRGLSTEIGRANDAKGNTLSGWKRRQLGRLRREQSRGRWRSKAERNLGHGLSETQRVTSALDLPKPIRDQACALFRSAATENLLRGRSIEAVAAASVYGACRSNGLPRTLAEIVEAAAVEHSRVENAYGVLNRELGIPAVPPAPTDFVHRIASELVTSDRTRGRAERLAARAEEMGIGNGCRPGGLAAGCLYAAAPTRREWVTQIDLAKCAGVSEPTVRSRWQELRSRVLGNGE